MSWGFVPEWASETRFTRPINARSETAHEKPMFRTAFSKQRCLVLCDGYYEWQRLSKGHKQPHYFCLPLGAPMILAGLWSSNDRLTGNVLQTFCVLTVSASDRYLTTAPPESSARPTAGKNNAAACGL
jgi:putative SOS response-associated peptidase YedK